MFSQKIDNFILKVTIFFVKNNKPIIFKILQSVNLKISSAKLKKKKERFSKR